LFVIVLFIADNTEIPKLMSSAETMGFIRFFKQRHFDHVISGVFRRDCYLSSAVQYNKTNMDYVTHFKPLYRSYLENLRRTESKHIIKTMTVKHYSKWIQSRWPDDVTMRIFIYLSKTISYTCNTLWRISWKLTTLYIFNTIYGSNAVWLKWFWLSVKCKYILLLVST